RLFNEFAVTIGVAVLISGFIALTLIPMLGHRFLGEVERKRHGAIYEWSERAYERSVVVYQAGLRWSLRHRVAVVVITIVVFGVTVWLFLAIPKGFIPSTDAGQIFAFTEAVEGISFDSLVEHQRAAAAVVAQNPNIEGFMSTVGARGGVGGTNSGVLFMRLKPRRERKANVDEVIQQLRGPLSKIPGMRVFLQNPPPIRFGGRPTKSQYQPTLPSAGTDGLYPHAPPLRAEM